MFHNFYNFYLSPPFTLCTKIVNLFLEDTTDLKNSIRSLFYTFSILLVEFQESAGLICSTTNPEGVHGK